MALRAEGKPDKRTGGIGNDHPASQAPALCNTNSSGDIQ